ncbi:MAG: hypothetical protein CMQ14_08355 [Gammaproteobacteria bacterium]|jgi:TPR repeat protein|nr:hypothetical protein [Gammaproteobacteria bacterium]|tara:strand:+ start:147 stop:605 length:459 start_codon:yes stop_codon:yes gene_type:complete
MKKVLVTAALLSICSNLIAFGEEKNELLFEKAKILADQGNAEAQFIVGAMYSVGDGVSQDMTRAARWLQLSAKQEVVAAHRTLGAMYALGYGGAQSNILAFAWFAIGAALGDEIAAEFRDAAVNTLSTAEREIATNLALKCYRSDYEACTPE